MRNVFKFLESAAKLEHVPHLHVIIMGVGVGPEFDLFDLNDFLLFTGFGFALLLLVLVFAVIHDLTDRRGRVGRNFDQVEPCFFGHFLGTAARHNTNIFTVSANQADFFVANSVIDAGAGVARWRRVMGSTSYGFDPLIVRP